MSIVRSLIVTMLTTLLSVHAMADSVDQAKQLIKLVNADQIVEPWFTQVDQMFAIRFVELQALDSKKPVLESYQAKAKDVLNKSLSWNKLEPEVVTVYTRAFTEAELKQLVDFYKSPVGQKMIKEMPVLFGETIKLSRTKLEEALPGVKDLMEEMTKELAPKEAAAKKT